METIGFVQIICFVEFVAYGSGPVCCAVVIQDEMSWVVSCRSIRSDAIVLKS